jgi:hypothetical protein
LLPFSARNMPLATLSLQMGTSRGIGISRRFPSL